MPYNTIFNNMYNNNNNNNNVTTKNVRDREEYEEFPDGSSRMLNFNSPPQEDFNTPEMIGSMQRILSQNLNEYVVVEFLIGTERIVRKQGILYLVGRNYVTLFDDINNNFIVCDIFSIKFVYFYFPQDRPQRNYNLLPNTNSN